MADANKKRILIIDNEFNEVLADVNARFEDVELVCPAEGSDIKSVLDGSFDGVITKQATVDRSLLDSVKGVRALVKLGRNYSNVDVEAVRERNLQFAAAPRKGPNAVAELGITLVLSLSKDLIINHESVVSGAYRLRGIKPEKTQQRKFAFHWMKNERVHEVVGKTIGIVGMGEIGCEMAVRAVALGMKVVYYKRSRLSEELENRFQAEYRSLEDLLKESDYVCLAVPQTPETENMIGKEQLDLMKESAYLVNVCRGGVIDEDVMIEYLSENRIAGAGLDVFVYEPLPAESPLTYLDNVIMMPHIGGGTGTNKIIELSAAVEEMNKILSGKQPRINLNN